ncbi:GGDEF domain-containing protein [Desulfonatronum sp. SC1]|uniref:sensor domain-containing diguanylate cyclase n=1 Tax=Desulfonatronum sp. SC1 TaxID=2109626 RepID=UPI000D30AB28|nr:GGDEF domain-containing protein [Desulfonatronum sp. SC1]PTN38294.1 GGDEF domain-containing protein [Desulfonatronum sp. SC1]
MLMSTPQSQFSILSAGLSPRQEEDIQAILGPDYSLERYQPSGKNKSTNTRQRLMTLISWKGVNARISAFQRGEFQEDDAPPRVLILDSEVAQADLERVVDAGFAAVLRYPFESERVRELVRDFQESQGLYKDLFHMAREICLEREILSRQADLLQFFNKILTNASFSLDSVEILHQAYQDLQILLPVKGVDAIFWQKSREQQMEAELFIHEYSGKVIQDKMIGFLLENAAKYADESMDSYHVNFMSKMDGDEKLMEIRDEDVLVLPLRFGGKSFGCISIASERIARLGRDRLQTILAAVNHLALALRNALLYREMRTRADRDALTRLPNRHFFDERLVQELKRHQRYRNPLSLMVMDLDHFKRINDTFGHQAGDMVLRDVGRLLQDMLRSSDLAARYGGEEFVLLLSHTTEEQAWVLAERIRDAIAKRRFNFKGKFFRVTVSIGIASLETGLFGQNVDLFAEADAALYRAKAGGRNMVCLAGEEDDEEPCRKYA